MCLSFLDGSFENLEREGREKKLLMRPFYVTFSVKLYSEEGLSDPLGAGCLYRPGPKSIYVTAAFAELVDGRCRGCSGSKQLDLPVSGALVTPTGKSPGEYSSRSSGWNSLVMF